MSRAIKSAPEKDGKKERTDGMGRKSDGQTNANTTEKGKKKTTQTMFVEELQHVKVAIASRFVYGCRFGFEVAANNATAWKEWKKIHKNKCFFTKAFRERKQKTNRIDQRVFRLLCFFSLRYTALALTQRTVNTKITAPKKNA